jgi:hypothetical protein
VEYLDDLSNYRPADRGPSTLNNCASWLVHICLPTWHRIFYGLQLTFVVSLERESRGKSSEQCRSKVFLASVPLDDPAGPPSWHLRHDLDIDCIILYPVHTIPHMIIFQLVIYCTNKFTNHHMMLTNLLSTSQHHANGVSM